jgi:hypothetical protein
MMSNLKVDIPFNIFTASENDIDKEACLRKKKMILIEAELKRFEQYYEENIHLQPPENLIDNENEYLKLKEYLKEISTSIFYQEALARHLKQLEKMKENLSGFEILQEVENTLRLRMSCPDWLYYEYRKRFLAVAEGEVNDFGNPKSFGSYPFKNKAHKIRNYTGVNQEVYLLVKKLLEKGKPLTSNKEGKGIFVFVADNCEGAGSPKTVDKIYYRVKDSLEEKAEFDLFDDFIHKIGNR